MHTEPTPVNFDEELYEVVNHSCTILGCELHQTCSCCPEQYDVFLEGKQIGYLRLRHGFFRADYPDCGGTCVYTANPMGDGIFEDDERIYYLTEAVKALLDEHRSE